MDGGRFDVYVMEPWFGVDGGRPPQPVGLRDAFDLLKPLFPALGTKELYELVRCQSAEFCGLSEERKEELLDVFIQIGKLVRVVDHDPDVPEPEYSYLGRRWRDWFSIGWLRERFARVSRSSSS